VVPLERLEVLPGRRVLLRFGQQTILGLLEQLPEGIDLLLRLRLVLLSARARRRDVQGSFREEEVVLLKRPAGGRDAIGGFQGRGWLCADLRQD